MGVVETYKLLYPDDPAPSAEADGGRLIVMLYEGAIAFLRTAKEKLEAGEYALKGVYIGKAQDIVAALNEGLNTDAAPEVAGNLRALYRFVHQHLTKANIERSADKIDQCITVLDNLCEGWRAAARE